MPVTVYRVPPGPTATAWLVSRIRGLQKGHALAAATVVVPDHHAGLYLRRLLASTGGYAAVRFTVIARLAEMLGAGRLGRKGRLPLTSAVRGALLRGALRAGG